MTRFPEKAGLKYSIVRHDVTSNCNLRCRFCVHDWNHEKPNRDMDISTFSKVLSILPLVKDQGFYFSCLYEPMIHKDLAGLVRIIPKIGRDKVFLTTNLATHLSDDIIGVLKKSHLHHINISLESFRPDIYKYLCPGGKFEIFFDNLTRLTNAFRNSRDAPAIRYITMVLRSNYAEIPGIAWRCHDEFLADNHEFRTPYGYSINSIDPSWFANETLTRDQLDTLVSGLKQLPFPACFSMETDDTLFVKTRFNRKMTAWGTDNFCAPWQMRDLPYSHDEILSREPDQDFFGLRVFSDGTIYFPGTGEKYKIGEIDQPFDFFSSRLNHLMGVQASRFTGKKRSLLGFLISSGNAMLMIDSFFENNDFLTIRGWGIVKDADCTRYRKQLVIRNGWFAREYTVDTCERADVAEHFDDTRYSHAGFTCIIGKNELPKHPFRIGMVFLPRSGLKRPHYTEFHESFATGRD